MESLEKLVEESKEDIEAISEENLIEISKYKSPPERIKKCLEGVFLILKGKILDWKEIKSEMNNGTFLDKILKMNVSKIPKKILTRLRKEYIEQDFWDIEKLRRASKAIKPLADWVDGIGEYALEKKKLEPFEEQLNEIKSKRKKIENNLKK